MGLLDGVRIGWFCVGWKPISGGAELAHHHLAQRMAQEGANLTVYTMAPKHQDEPEITDYEVKRFTKDYTGPKIIDQNYWDHWSDKALKPFARLQNLIDAVTEEEFDVFIIYNYTDTLGWHLKGMPTFKNTLLVSTIWDPDGNRIDPWANWSWNIPADLEVLGSRYVANRINDQVGHLRPVIDLPPLKVETKADYVWDSEEWESRPYDFCFMNPIPHKGVTLVAQLVGRMPDHKFLIKRGNYQDQTLLNKLDEWYPNVTVAGWYDHMDDFYRQSKCLLYPSIQEGFGMPPLEAAANGCLVFANDHPIIRDATPEGPVFIRGYPELSYQNFWLWSHQSSNRVNADIVNAADVWESAIEETLWDPELCYRKIQEGLAYYPKHLQRVEKAFARFCEYLRRPTHE
jgi:glycosyltransferase involved in cell wall biosynthesis